MATNNKQAAVNNRANQLNPNHPAYHKARGASDVEANELARLDQKALDNHANQLNPNHKEYKGSGENK